MRVERPSGGTCTTMRLAPPDQSSASVAPPRVNRARAGVGIPAGSDIALVGAIAGDDPRKLVVGALERSEPPALIDDRDGKGGKGGGRMALSLVTAHGLLVVGDVAAQRGQLCRM